MSNTAHAAETLNLLQLRDYLNNNLQPSLNNIPYIARYYKLLQQSENQKKANKK